MAVLASFMAVLALVYPQGLTEVFKPVLKNNHRVLQSRKRKLQMEMNDGLIKCLQKYHIKLHE